jgi:plasmid stability protein
MSALIILDVEENVLVRLRERAIAHGRTPEVEAKRILIDALQPPAHSAWAQVETIRQRLAESGRMFSDSADLLREDRDR